MNTLAYRIPSSPKARATIAKRLYGLGLRGSEAAIPERFGYLIQLVSGSVVHTTAEDVESKGYDVTTQFDVFLVKAEQYRKSLRPGNKYALELPSQDYAARALLTYLTARFDLEVTNLFPEVDTGTCVVYMPGDVDGGKFGLRDMTLLLKGDATLEAGLTVTDSVDTFTSYVEGYLDRIRKGQSKFPVQLSGGLQLYYRGHDETERPFAVGHASKNSHNAITLSPEDVEIIYETVFEGWE